MAHPQRSLPFELIALDYIESVPRESLADYASRFWGSIQSKIDFQRPVVIAGASIGGAIAQEIARIRQPNALILIGSLRSSRELHPIIRLFGRHIASKLPNFVYWSATPLVPIVMRIVSRISEADVRLCQAMYRSLPRHWFREGFRMIAGWPGCDVRVPTLRIHGNDDHIIPFRGIQDVDVLIERAKHLSSMSKPDEVNRAIRDFIERTVL